MHPLNQKLIELLPDLKEFTFGCEVEINNHRAKVIQEEYNEESDGLNSFIVRYEENDKFEEMRIMRELLPEEGNGDWQYSFEILGRPPQLSDVLRAVYRTMTEMTRHDGEKQEAILSMLKWYVTPEGDVREPIWNLSLGLNDQPEDTKQFILSILNK